jgi:hypothetical protein
MNSQTLKIKPVSFVEHPVIDFSQSEPCSFDVTTNGLNYPPSFIVDGIFCFEAYCEALLRRIKILDKAEITDFLDYQCKSLKDPTEWLNQFETLIDLNFDYYSEECLKAKLRKLYVNIQVYRESIKHHRKPLKNQLVDWENIIPTSNLNKFDFNVVKYDLSKLDSYNAKKAYLIELKADFQQSENICSISANKSFGTLIDIELEKIEKLQEIPEQAIAPKIASEKQGSKLRINGNSNILVDIFYRLLYEFKPEGKPYIDNTPAEVAIVIANTFVNREGKKLSQSTVQTTLCPSKVEKRPSCDRRFCMKHLIPLVIAFCYTYIFEYISIMGTSSVI